MVSDSSKSLLPSGTRSHLSPRLLHIHFCWSCRSGMRPGWPASCVVINHLRDRSRSCLLACDAGRRPVGGDLLTERKSL